MVMYCSVYGCFSTSKNDKNRSFFRFPKTELRCKQWIRAVGRPELIHKSFDILNRCYFACDLHFQETDRLVKKLKANAVPSQNLPHHENVNPEKSTQTYETTIELRPKTENSSSQTYQPRTLDAKTQTTQNISADTGSKRKILSDFETDSKKQKTENPQETNQPGSETNCDMSSQLQKLSDFQNRLKGISSNKLCDRDFKLFSLKLYIANPLAYSVLATTLSLPSEDSLRQIHIGTKLHQIALECLEFKFKSLKESEKHCILSVNEISLKRTLDYDINEDKIVGFHEIDGTQTKELATQAFVIMASGIFSDWVQPLGYCLLAQSKNYKELHTWINETISEIINIGFRVAAFVSDHSTIFMNFANSQHVFVDKPYFSINGNKIYYIFDVPNLIVAVRNNFLKYDFKFLDTDGNQLTAKWVDIQQFYRQDCERAYRLAPKLTESHIIPNTIDKFDVTYAAQIFSNTVGAAMNHLVKCGRLDNISMGTVHFIELMNKTFDVLNSSVLHDPNNYKSAFAALPHQTETLDEFEQFLSNVTVVNKTNMNVVTHSLTCLKSFAITIKSIKYLSRDMRANDFSALFTRRLNQERLQNFFTSVRQQAKCRDPTPMQFSRAFRESFMENLLKQSKHEKSSDNLDQLLINIDDLGGINIIENLQHDVTGQYTLTSEIGAGLVDHRFDLPTKDPFVYVCGYFLEKCFDIHKCDDIKQYIKSKDVHTHALLLINPPKSFVSYIKTMDDRIKLVFKNEDLDCIGKKILKELSDISVSDCCACFPNLYLKKLFVTFRIFNIVKNNNKLLRDKIGKQKTFSVSDDFLV